MHLSLKKQWGDIDWTMDADCIERLVRGLKFVGQVPLQRYMEKQLRFGIVM